MAPLRSLDDEVFEASFNKGQFFRLLRYLNPYRKQIIASLALMVLAAVCGLSGPYLMSRAIDVLETKDAAPLPWLVGGMVLASMVGAFCLRMRVRTMDTAGRKAIATLRQDLFNHIQTLSFSFFDSRSAGKIMVRVINDVNSLNELFTGGIINVLVDCLTLVLLVIIMLVINWQLTLVALCSLTALFVLITLLRTRMRRAWQMVRVKTSTMNGYLHESLAGMRVTQAFVREQRNRETFEDTNEDIRQSWLRAVGHNNLFWPCIDTLSSFGTAGVYIVGLLLMGTGTHVAVGLSLADLLVILWYLNRFWEPINNLANFYNSVLTAMASIERIYEIMDTPADIADASPDSPELPPIEGAVAFEDVTFGYTPELMVLRNVSFCVQPGQTIALVGPTGAGKSTVVNLISRFCDVTSGAVRIDGYDVRDVKLHSLRSQMSVMLQDSFIFSGTVIDNIRYGRPEATEEEVMAAARAVHVHDFVMQLPKGYNTEVFERGSSLSVGQKQLISFARALLCDPRILILDEATSSIDTHTELLIQQAMEVLLKGRTSFVIAHRLSTIRKADCIMVVHDHGIAEAGTHEQLMQLEGGHYRSLCEAQYRFMQGA